MSLALRRGASECWAVRLLDDGVEGLLELLMEPLRAGIGGVVVGAPLRIEGLEGVRDDGKEDSEAWRSRVLVVLLVVPLVEGR